MSPRVTRPAHAAPSLTKISFRRDVRTFLTVLVGFLAVLIFILLLLLQQFSRNAQTMVVRQWNAVADAAAAQIGDARDPTDLRVRALVLMTKYDIRQIDVAGPVPQHFGSGNGSIDVNSDATFLRHSPAGTLRFTFDDSDVRDSQQRLAVTVAICVAAAVTGLILLAMYIPRITRPIEKLLDHAREVGAPGAQQDETTYLIETFRDSIDRLKAQELELKRLHEAEKTRADELEMVTATLTRSLTSGFLAMDPSARVLEVNAAAREILCIAPDADVQVEIGALIGDSALADLLRRAAREGETMTRIEVEHTAAGNTLAIGLTAVPLKGEGLRLLGILALFTDLTPIKALEGRVRAMQTLAELGEIAAGIAHEFRNSLSTILGYVKLLLRTDLPAEAVTRLHAAEREANLLTQAVERLLTFTKPMTLQVERIDLRALTESILENLRAVAPEIAFTIDGDATIDGDRALLSRAVENVLRNAVDAVRDRGAEGKVDVTLRQDPPSIAVADNGVGFDEADAARLVLPFVSNKPGGFGLGLSLTRKIVVLHGGDLKLNGTPGRGAVMTLQFGDSGA
jgi:signal transduction histidine kinase